MGDRVDLRVVELLAARLCHELIGPIAAIINGAELLADEEPDFVREAVSLVGDSAGQAGRRLQFYRFAYGFSGSGGLTGLPPAELAGEFFTGTRVTLEYGESVRALGLERQKLACNLLAIAADALPRGGRLVLSANEAGLELSAIGAGAVPAAEAQAALALTATTAELTSRSVGAYYTGLLAADLGYRVVVTLADAVPSGKPGGEPPLKELRLCTAPR